MIELSLVLSSVSIIAVIVFSYFAISAKIEVEAMKKSTHKIQYVPMDEKALTGKDLAKALMGDDDEDHLQ